MSLAAMPTPTRIRYRFFGWTLVRTPTAVHPDDGRFRRMRDEIARMPPDIALDLGICPGDAEELARKAVYGR